MARYRYRAMDPQGTIVRGSLEAVNPLDLEMRLRRISLDLITFRAESARRLRKVVRARADLINFCFHLEQLLRAGVPLVDALRDLRDTGGERGLRDLTANLIEGIEGGARLSDAMEQQGGAFDAVFVNLVRAGEESGELPEVLLQLSENLRWQDEMMATTRKLLLYPAISGVAVGAMILFLFVYLVPRLAEVLRSLSTELPAQTLMLLAVSRFLADWWPLLLVLPPLLLLPAIWLVRREPGLRLRWDRLLLRIPRLGGVYLKIILARFSTYFALLYGAGIPILDCIRICERIVGNAAVRLALEQAGRAIGDGQGLTAAFRSAGLFPPLVLRMMSVGETTGGLDRALGNVAYFYNRDVREAVESLQQLLQPMILLVLGGVLAGVLVPIFGPIYDTVSHVRF
ncbi:MAG: type II secretion system F family protein [Pseudomonadota bacterium]|nr:type II secretion system F family protein [Pseudomonadota bacterium]